MKEKAASKKVMFLIYASLCFGMYFSRNTYFTFAGIGWMYRYLWVAGIFILNVCVFLANVDLDRAVYLVKLGGILCFPHVWTIFISTFIWISKASSLTVLRRGFFNELYAVTMILTMMGMIYVLGEDAIWCNLLAMLLPNVIILAGTIVEFGFSQYMSELQRIIVTFADEAGPAISQMEVHELTFSLGVYVVYLVYILQMKKTFFTVFLIAGAVFFFLSGFKRIGMLAVVVAAAVYIFVLLASGHGKRGRGFLIWSGIIVIVMMIGYVAIVDFGLLEYLERQAGVNLMGRDNLLAKVKEYFYFSPGYPGYGAGFTYELMNDLKGTGLHNDIVALYVDIGFWGFIFWMVFYVPVKVYLVSKLQDIKGGMLAIAYSVYLLVTAFTDNTMNYTFVTGTIALMIMAYGLDNSPSLKYSGNSSGENYEKLARRK